MNLSKIVTSLFLFIFLFSAHSSFSQKIQKEIYTEKQLSKPIKKADKMKLSPYSKIEREQKGKNIEKQKSVRAREVAQKNRDLYPSKARIERAKTDLLKKKKAGNISEKEALAEENRIKNSEKELAKKSKNASSFSKKLEKMEPVKEN